MLRGAKTALIAGAVTSLAFAAQAYASPTDSDPGFNGGAVVLGSGTHDEYLAAMQVLGNGKTVVLMVTDNDPALVLYRLNQNGTPDSSFGGGDGRVGFASAANYEDVRLAVDPRTGKDVIKQ